MLGDKICEILALSDDYLYSRDVDALIEDVYANIATLAEMDVELTPRQRLELSRIMWEITDVWEL